MEITSKCPKCNSTIEQGVTFCGNCKTKIVWKDGTPTISFDQKLDDIQQGLHKTGCSLMSLAISIPVLVILFSIFGC